MNNRQNAEELNTSIANHLGLRLPSVAPGQTPAHPDTFDDKNQANSDGAEDKTIHNKSSSLDTETALYNLLMGYVDLLEAREHGGWTLEEENTVKAAIAALLRAGWTAPQLYNIREENQITHYVAALLAEERKR